MPTTVLHTPAEGPDEPGRPVACASEPYWRHEMWRPARYRDSTGALADLVRRALTVLFRLRWRMTLDVTVRTFVPAADEQAACLAVTDALRHPDTVIALSRAEPDVIPPWRALCTADRVEIVADAHAVDAGGAGAPAGQPPGALPCRSSVINRAHRHPTTLVGPHD